MLITKSSILVIELKGMKMCIQFNMLVLVISSNYSEETLLVYIFLLRFKLEEVCEFGMDKRLGCKNPHSK
jgi:hypothetical protein